MTLKVTGRTSTFVSVQICLALAGSAVFAIAEPADAAETKKTSKTTKTAKTEKTTNPTNPGTPSSVSWSQAYRAGENELREGKLEEAEAHFRQAIIHVSSQSKDPADNEKCTLKLADTLALRDKTEEAQALYKKLLASLSKRYGADSQQVVPVLFALGSIQEAAANHSAAMSYYRKALQINEKNWGPYSPAVADNLHRLGRATYKSGDKPGAEKHYKKAISILSKDASLTAATRLESLVHDYHDLLQGNDDSNKQLLRDFNRDIYDRTGQERGLNPNSASDSGSSPGAGSGAASPNAGNKTSSWQEQKDENLKQTRQAQTDADPQIALRGPIPDQSLKPAYDTVQSTIFKEKRYDAGEDNYKRMIATDIDALGPHHPSVANDSVGLAQLYISQGKYRDAAPLLNDALSIYEKTYGNNNSLTVTTAATLALVEFHLGNTEKAAELYRDALSNGQSVLGPNDLETANILNQLAYLYYHQGKLADSATFYQWAVSSTEGAVGNNDPLLAACLKDYAQVLKSLGKNEQAQELEARASKIGSSSRTTNN